MSCRIFGTTGRNNAPFSSVTFRNKRSCWNVFFNLFRTKKACITGCSLAFVKTVAMQSRTFGFSADEKCWNARQQMHEINQIKRVSVEGNIAVGKSTFAKLLQSASNAWEVVSEPVSRWQKVDTSQQSASNLLDMMYRDPQRWAYTFQTFSCTSRMRTQLRPPASRLRGAPGSPVQVFERSVYSDRYVFALNMFQLGCINSTEWAVYQDWHSFVVEQFGQRLQLDGIIYLKASPEICHKRLGRRGRNEEKGVKLDYLENLHNQHENWLVQRTTELHFEQLKQVPVLVLDASDEFEKDPDVQKEFVEQVTDFFNSL